MLDLIGRSISSKADCNGVVGGLAYFDECDQCVEGNTNLIPCSLDAEYVWRSTPLPAELIQFTGQLIENRTRLDWVSASEINLATYEIERSQNATDWEYFDKNQANNRPSSYTEWDPKPFSDFTYYRLKIVVGSNSPRTIRLLIRSRSFFSEFQLRWFECWHLLSKSQNWS